MRLTSYMIGVTALSLLGFINCTDVIEVDIEEVPPQLVIDAWLNNRSETQTIRLTLTQDYFNSALAGGVSDAGVIVMTEDGRTLTFEHQDDGNYTWTPPNGENIGQIGLGFELLIDWNNTFYSASSRLNRVPEIDSIQIEFRDDELGGPDGHYAQFFARDPVGVNDTYWIKAFKNGVFLNKPFELNLAYDAGFAAGAETDGLVFITPIREAINRVPDPDTEDDDEVPPWAPGDEVYVEIHSITNEAFDFLRIARDQMTNGANTIFAIPLANTGTNVASDNPDESAVGFFCVSAISSMAKSVE